MDSSLTASLLLLSVVFMQFVSAADQNNATIKAEPGENVVLTCKDPDQGKIKIAEWKRTDLGSSEYVLLYKDDQLDPGAQHPSYRDRVDLLCNQIMKGDVSLLLKNTTTDDSGTYECRIDTEKLEGKLISTVSLQVSPPPPPEQFPFWAIVLLVLLVPLVLAAAAGVSFYFWLRWKPVPEKVEVEPWEESVLLPFKVPHRLWFCKYRLSVAKVEWRNVRDNRKVHVYQNGSDQPGEQDEFYRTRTRMDENLLKTGDLSLILRRPTDEDENLYSCRVYNRKGDVLMEKQVWLKVKVPEQVEVKSGEESVLLSCRTTESLDGDTKVEWVDKYDRTVHVYQNGSDQSGEQHQYYRTRTRMDENLLETKDLSLTLRWPRYEDSNIYTCRVYRDRDVLMVKQVNLWVKVQQLLGTVCSFLLSSLRTFCPPAAGWTQQRQHTAKCQISSTSAESLKCFVNSTT
ncbi:uncharacterized protein LOC106938728 isoform X1 [Poecilia latipinna]|uniref:uncharacterized protein LOC106938728 isoform X1 n=1 Tax=Poecilia latipinna TaxID=48699 RepID=UPI00072DA151|nr:PREDICTED: uncharacterized protein LOC106938728 isoform X1 [Poecilia latipinna]